MTIAPVSPGTEEGRLHSLDRGAATSSVSAHGLPSDLAEAYQIALQQGLKPLDLADIFPPARAGRVVEHLARWSTYLDGGRGCDACGSLLPRTDPRFPTDGPRWSTVEGLHLCGDCASRGDLDAVRAAVLQQVCGLRHDQYLPPFPVLFCEGERVPGRPWQHLGGDTVLQLRDWAAQVLQQVEFLPAWGLTPQWCSRMEGIVTLRCGITSRVPETRVWVEADPRADVPLKQLTRPSLAASERASRRAAMRDKANDVLRDLAFGRDNAQHPNPVVRRAAEARRSRGMAGADEILGKR